MIGLAACPAPGRVVTESMVFFVASVAGDLGAGSPSYLAGVKPLDACTYNLF